MTIAWTGPPPRYFQTLECFDDVAGQDERLANPFLLRDRPSQASCAYSPGPADELTLHSIREGRIERRGPLDTGVPGQRARRPPGGLRSAVGVGGPQSGRSTAELLDELADEPSPEAELLRRRGQGQQMIAPTAVVVGLIEHVVQLRVRRADAGGHPGR